MVYLSEERDDSERRIPLTADKVNAVFA